MGWFVVGFMVLLAVLLIPAYVYDQRRRRMATDRLPPGAMRRRVTAIRRCELSMATEPAR